jgi:hypothetical protein
VLASPPAEFEYKPGGYEGRPVQVPKSFEAEEKLGKVLKLPDLSREEIAQRLKQAAALESEAAKEKWSANVLPAFIITAPVWIAISPAIARDHSKAAKLVEKFDPLKINLGMNVREVNSMYGEPVRQYEKGNGILHVYGVELPVYATSQFDPVWLAVQFEGDKVTRVFSHRFFDKRLLKKTPAIKE